MKMKKLFCWSVFLLLSLWVVGACASSYTIATTERLSYEWVVPSWDVVSDSANGPALTTAGITSDTDAGSVITFGGGNLGTAGQCQYNAWRFDADGGSTGDDIVYIHWLVPTNQNYVADGARLDVYWSYIDAETDGDTVVFDMAVNAIQAAAVSTTGTGDDIDTAGTAYTETNTIVANAGGIEGALLKTTLNFEVEDIAAGDWVTIKFWVDESASALASGKTVNIHKFVIKWGADNAE
jgi:hypothetical protein